ncbi:MAG: hypothetical protein CEE38_18680 [Planctomycetes bacterium B3_Pla]|nr:MAG: hypothetical protein CEE38_18680 [Planctomycetes bacterium B3_Pla]
MTDRVLGSFRHGHFPDLFLDATADLMNVELTKIHESIHRILEYSSAHGLLITFLIFLSNKDLSKHPLSAELDKVIRLLHRAEFHVQEGCATFLTLNACMAGFGKAQADRLLGRIPQEYQVATTLVSDCLSATRSNQKLGPLVVKNMEFIVHGIALAALNSTICTEFSMPDAMTVARVRSFLTTGAPSIRLSHIREYLSIQRNVEAYVGFCADASIRAAGDLPLYDHNFMREYMTKHPVEWEECHRHLEIEMRRQLVNWFSQQGVVDIDPSYDFFFSDPSHWSPMILIRDWEKQLGLNTGLLDSIEWTSETPIQRHIETVHSVRYSLEDKRRVFVPRDTEHRSQAIDSVSSRAPDVVVKVIYLPVGNDFPDIGIKGDRRLILDMAFYRGLVSLWHTLRVDGVSIAAANRLVLERISCSLMTTLYNYQQLEVDVGRVRPYLPGIHIFFTPGEFDMLEHIRSRPGPFSLRHSTSFGAGRDWAEDVELPGMIEIEERLEGGHRVYFCMADKHLLGSYRKILSREPKLQDQGASVSDGGRRCAIEACYGFDSVLKRSQNGVFRI